MVLGIGLAPREAFRLRAAQVAPGVRNGRSKKFVTRGDTYLFSAVRVSRVYGLSVSIILIDSCGGVKQKILRRASCLQVGNLDYQAEVTDYRDRLRGELGGPRDLPSGL